MATKFGAPAFVREEKEGGGERKKETLCTLRTNCTVKFLAFLYFSVTIKQSFVTL